MKKTLVTLVLILNMVAVPAAAVALDTTSGEAQGPAPHKATLIDIEDCNRQILLKEIELERYSINFRKKNNVQGRYRAGVIYLAGSQCLAHQCRSFAAIERTAKCN